MTLLTRTGLLEGRRRPVARRPRGGADGGATQGGAGATGAPRCPLDVAPLCKAAPYSLRPLAALLNPYARGCSVLCNHPADNQSRDALRRIKETWPTERVLAGEDALPEELFRRYTDTDSRPHSPPTHLPAPCRPSLVAPPPTAGTSATLGGLGRRCRTPDPYHPDQQGHHLGHQQRTLLVLDLRRSRSHDTLSLAAPSESGIWPAPHGAPPAMMVSPPSPNEAVLSPRRYPGGGPGPGSAGGPVQRRTTPRTPCPSLAASRPTSQQTSGRAPPPPPPANSRATSRAASRSASSRPQGSQRGRPHPQRSASQPLHSSASVEAAALPSPEPPRAAPCSPCSLSPDLLADGGPAVVVTCADELQAEDDEVVRRRGKKRRGKKSGKDALREPEKEIHGFPEPGETQVSAIGDDSHNPSSRTSLTGLAAGQGPGGAAAGGASSGAPPAHRGSAAVAAAEAARQRAISRSFLDADSLSHLQRDLDLETVECEFDAKRRVALEEAFRLLPTLARRRGRGASLSGDPGSAPSALLSVPRVFSLRSARFELPLNSASLNSLTPMEYVSRHVEVCDSSAHLYRRVFNRHHEGAEPISCPQQPDEQQLQQQQQQKQQLQQQQQPQQQQQEQQQDIVDLDEEPRHMLGKQVVVALADVLGRPLTDSEASDLRDRLGWSDEERLSFRTWCGVSALAERLLALPGLNAKAEVAAEAAAAEPRPELEQADLAGLQRRLARLTPDPRLVAILVEMSQL